MYKHYNDVSIFDIFWTSNELFTQILYLFRSDGIDIDASIYRHDLLFFAHQMDVELLM